MEKIWILSSFCELFFIISTQTYTLAIRQKTHPKGASYNKDIFMDLSWYPHLFGRSEMSRLGWIKKVDLSTVYFIWQAHLSREKNICLLPSPILVCAFSSDHQT